MLKEVSFEEATPFVRFLEEHKHKLIGRPIRKLYSDSEWSGLAQTPYTTAVSRFGNDTRIR